MLMISFPPLSISATPALYHAMIEKLFGGCTAARLGPPSALVSRTACRVPVPASTYGAENARLAGSQLTIDDGTTPEAGVGRGEPPGSE
jgi:hypothetical protein